MMIPSDSLARYGAILAVSLAFPALTYPSHAEAIDDLMAATSAVHSFYCISPTSGPQSLVFVSTGDTMKLMPMGVPARRVGDVFTADLDDGTLTVGGGSFVSMTADGADTGTCQDFNMELIAFLSAIFEADPAAFSAIATPLVAMNNDGQMQAASEEIANLKEQVAALSSNSEVAKLQKNIEELKLRICKLDPKATFSVCKDGAPSP